MRIQILTLPSQKVGEIEKYPFAFIFDEAEALIDDSWSRFESLSSEIRRFGDECGAVATAVFPGTVEVL